MKLLSPATLGYLAGCITVVSFVPQVLRAWRTRRTRDLSLGAFTLLASGAVLWLAYGLMIGDWPVIATNLAVLVLVSAILVAKLRFDGTSPAEGGQPAGGSVWESNPPTRV
jgi:MtN3 and saliva related transmembrane protein